MTWRSMAAAVPFVVVLLIASPAGTASLPSTPPEEVGLSSERLGRLGQWFTQEIAQGRLPGAVALVARRGRVAYLESFGSRDPVIGAPMTSDAIFRLASMTKPFTSVAAIAGDSRVLLAEVTVYQAMGSSVARVSDASA